MKFFIFGDSWGVGEWHPIGILLKSVPNTGLDYWLKSHGHDVTNVSAGSASNFGQLRHAYWKLKEKSDYDYIIWFYTEPFRDIIETVIMDPTESMLQYPEFDISDFPDCNYITKQNLKYAQMIYEEFLIPFYVIGGACKLPKEIDNYPFCYQKIQNWGAELLDLDLEFPNYVWGSWHKFDKIFDHFKINVKEFVLSQEENLDKVKTICEKSDASNKFPDNAHPGRYQFQTLCERILNEINAR